MAILVTCGACGAKLRVRDEYAGKDVWCPSCKVPLTLNGERVPNHEVFISYSNKDKAVADAICATLEEKKIRCWIAPRDISAGNSWGGSIIEAIEDAQVMVLVYSGSSNLSPQVIREVERAVAKGLVLVPFRIETVPMSKEMEYFLSSSHWFDALTPPLEKHLAQFAEMVRLLLFKNTKVIKAAPSTGTEAVAKLPSNTLLRIGATGVVIGAIFAIGAFLGMHQHRQQKDIVTPTPTNLDVSSASTGQLWTNSLGMIFLPVPGTEVLFGKYEVTNAEYRKWKPRHDSGDKKSSGTSLNGDRQPVLKVSWDDAKAFCRWLTDKESSAGLIEVGQEYRLPQDWEWSVAVGLNEPKEGTPRDKDCKIKDVYPWNHGRGTWPPPYGVGNYEPSLKTDDYDATSPVGSFTANDFSLFDIGGNVSEWCEDWYDTDQKQRVCRDGNYSSGRAGPDYYLSSARHGFDPKGCGYGRGFRVVLTTAHAVEGK